ncbi:MAG: di-heme oxidoredictase family protein [Burkholderiaceae bacterium]
MAKDTMMSRIAPQVIGMGLLEAIPESGLANLDEQAAAPLGVRAWPTGSGTFAQKSGQGRFGWRPTPARSVAHQSAGAFKGDMGITSSVFWREACTEAQKDCLAAPHGGGKRTGRDGLMPA